MSVSEEMLMAYADGELDAVACVEVEAALAADPQLVVRVAAHRALRERLRTGFAGVLDEPVPERLLAAARNTPENIVPMRETARPRAAWRLPHWAAMAASLVAGVLIARLLFAPGGEFEMQGGRLVAGSELAQALGSQLANESAGSIRIGLSFRARDGEYCRSFSVQHGALGGLACHHDRHWQVAVLAASATRATPEDAARPAAGDLPPAVLAAIEERVEGEPLDAETEAAAKARGWQR